MSTCEEILYDYHTASGRKDLVLHNPFRIAAGNILRLCTLLMWLF